MSTIVVVAPHPDDETLGCGGTLLRHRAEGDTIYWLIVTHMHDGFGVSNERRNEREKEIATVSSLYGFKEVYNLRFPTTELDTVGQSRLVDEVKNVFSLVKPDVVYLPYRGDIHTDHAAVFDTVIACTKWFRFPSIRKVVAYETLSETEFNLNPDTNLFRPNLFVNISDYLDKKISIMQIFASEIGSMPFPRSEEVIRALAIFRGATAGCHAAEAFMVLKEII